MQNRQIKGQQTYSLLFNYYLKKKEDKTSMKESNANKSEFESFQICCTLKKWKYTDSPIFCVKPFSKKKKNKEIKKKTEEKKKEYLICKTDTKAEQDPTDNQHPNLLCKAINKSTNKEKKTSEKHGKFSTKLTSNGGSHQRRQ